MTIERIIDKQPREHDVLCQRCFTTRTWNPSAVCDACELIEVQRCLCGMILTTASELDSGECGACTAALRHFDPMRCRHDQDYRICGDCQQLKYEVKF